MPLILKGLFVLKRDVKLQLTNSSKVLLWNQRRKKNKREPANSRSTGKQLLKRRQWY